MEDSDEAAATDDSAREHVLPAAISGPHGYLAVVTGAAHSILLPNGTVNHTDDATTNTGINPGSTDAVPAHATASSAEPLSLPVDDALRGVSIGIGQSQTAANVPAVVVTALHVAVEGGEDALQAVGPVSAAGDEDPNVPGPVDPEFVAPAFPHMPPALGHIAPAAAQAETLGAVGPGAAHGVFPGAVAVQVPPTVAPIAPAPLLQAIAPADPGVLHPVIPFVIAGQVAPPGAPALLNQALPPVMNDTPPVGPAPHAPPVVPGVLEALPPAGPPVLPAHVAPLVPAVAPAVVGALPPAGPPIMPGHAAPLIQAVAPAVLGALPPAVPPIGPAQVAQAVLAAGLPAVPPVLPVQVVPAVPAVVNAVPAAPAAVNGPPAPVTDMVPIRALLDGLHNMPDDVLV